MRTMNSASANEELARISSALVNALRDAYSLAQSGQYGAPLRDAVIFARDLVALAEEILAADPQAGEHARGMALQMAEQLAALESLLGSLAGM
jgi:hypothetical protein